MKEGARHENHAPSVRDGLCGSWLIFLGFIHWVIYGKRSAFY
jgi:hypothetical protein